jgi:hypothetical protein
MSQHGPEGRSYEPVTFDDLRCLLDIAEADTRAFFARHCDWAEKYEERILGYVLAQGAANHYFGRGDGVQDFDVYLLLAEHPAKPWRNYRRRAIYDFGHPKFGRSPDNPDFVGRRVDVLSRALRAAPGSDLKEAVQEWLGAPHSKTAKFLSQKAVVLLSPSERTGEVVWPVQGAGSGTEAWNAMPNTTNLRRPMSTVAVLHDAAANRAGVGPSAS